MLVESEGADWQNRAAGRVLAAVSILLVEYTLVGVQFDGSDLRSRYGFIGGVANLGELVTAALVVLTGGVLLNRRALVASLSHVAGTLPRPNVVWIALHLVAYAAAFACIVVLFRAEVSHAAVIALLVGGALFGLASVAALGVALFGAGVRALSVAFGRVALSGLVLGLLAWFAGLQSRPLWPLLAESTLVLSASLLSAFMDGVSVDVAEKTLAASNFEVMVDSGCSGIEGMGLVTVFLLGYLLRFRREIVVSRALFLLPAGVALAFLANSVRIAALVALGSYVSPDIAFGGFHSKAGWALFCALSISLVFLLHRSRLFSRELPVAGEIDNPTAAHCVPLLAFLAVGLVSSMFAASVDLFYAARVLAAVAALWWLRRYYAPIGRTASWLSAGVGLAVFAVWLVFSPHDAAASAALRARLDELSPLSRALWIAFRLAGGVVIVPVVEELAFRGFLQRRLVQVEFEALPYRRTTLFAVVISALAFGGLHSAWVLGTLAGAAYSLLTMHRGRLSDAIAAHAITNLGIAIAALGFGRWDLW
jgi:exosortase E/protease (VPEID-CTERM system)